MVPLRRGQGVTQSSNSSSVVMALLNLNFQTVATSVLFLVLSIIVKRRYFSALSDIPGPFVASFSILWQLYHIFKGHTEVEVIKLHRKYGDFVRISQKEVSIAHKDAVSQVLLAPLSKGNWYAIFSLPNANYVNIMSELDPVRHGQRTRNIGSGYTLSNVLRSEPYIDAMISLMKTRFDELIAAKKPIHLDHWFNFMAFDVLGEVTFSKSFGFVQEGRDIGGAVKNTGMLALYISVMGYLGWLHPFLLGNPIIDWLNLTPSQHIFDTTTATVEKRKANPEIRKDMLEQWTETLERVGPEKMEQNEIMAAAIANLGAGADTVSSILQGFFYYLLRAPEHFERLRNEIDEAQRRGELSKVVSHAEAQKLPFLQACIYETYRFHTPVGFGLPRVAPKEGITVAGRFFPAGTILSVNPWVFHRNPEIFGEDADTFNPTRWLDKDNAKHFDKFLLHWGKGYNRCVGQHLAHVEVSKTTATITRDYDIRQIDPNAEWHYKNHFTIVPYDWPCTATRRNVT